MRLKMADILIPSEHSTMNQVHLFMGIGLCPQIMCLLEAEVDAALEYPAWHLC